MNSSGTIFDVKGKHADSCYAKAEKNRTTLGIVDLNVEKKIERFDRFYAPLCRGNMSQQLVSTSKTSFLKVLEETKVDNYSFNGATNL